MKDDFANALAKARYAAHLTQESACSLLGISLRTIAYYENGGIIPSDDMVASMVRTYNAPWLGYFYLSTVSPTGQILLPKLIPHGIASMAICLRLAMDHASRVVPELDEICSDDVISNEEAPAMHNRIMPKLRELTAACMAMETIKIPETAGTVSGSLKREG